MLLVSEHQISVVVSSLLRLFRRVVPPGRRHALFLLPALVLLGGCAAGGSTLTVPVSQWPGYEYFPLAQKRGLDRREGIRLDLPAYANPQDIVHAYLRGDLKLAQLTTVEAVDLCNRVPKRCPVVILVLDESRGGDQVVVDRQLGSIAELRGQPVAITPSTLGPFVLSRALSRHGLGLGDVDLRPMPLETMPAAIGRGEVRAAALFPPFSDQAMATGRVRPLFTSREIPGEIFDILVVDPGFLKDHRTALTALLRSWQAAHDLALAEPGPSNAVMAAREGVSPAEFKASLAGLVFEPLARQGSLFAPGGVLERNLKALRAVQASLDFLPADAPLPPVDGSLLRDALKRAP